MIGLTPTQKRVGHLTTTESEKQSKQFLLKRGNEYVNPTLITKPQLCWLSRILEKASV